MFIVLVYLWSDRIKQSKWDSWFQADASYSHHSVSTLNIASSLKETKRNELIWFAARIVQLFLIAFLEETIETCKGVFHLFDIFYFRVCHLFRRNCWSKGINFRINSIQSTKISKFHHQSSKPNNLVSYKLVVRAWNGCFCNNLSISCISFQSVSEICVMKQQHFTFVFHCVWRNLNILVDRTTFIPCRIVDCIDKVTILHEFTCLAVLSSSLLFIWIISKSFDALYATTCTVYSEQWTVGKKTALVKDREKFRTFSMSKHLFRILSVVGFVFIFCLFHIVFQSLRLFPYTVYTIAFVAFRSYLKSIRSEFWVGLSLCVTILYVR